MKNKPYPFMLKTNAFNFNKCEIGQEIFIEFTKVEVTKIVSVEVLAGELLKIVGMCKPVKETK